MTPVFVSNFCRGLVLALLTASVMFTGFTVAQAQNLGEFSLDRWKQLREVERHQLQIAERYYAQKDWKVALAEYEKFLTLYEESEGAPYAQLRWSLCQANLRNQNTAIRDGYQSVIDYWPDSPEATAAAFYIARTYKEMGRIPEAKNAYQQVIAEHGTHQAAVLALVDLVEIANQEKDYAKRTEYQKKLTYDIPRNGANKHHCEHASRELANAYFYGAAFEEGVKALETTYRGGDVTNQMVSQIRGPIGHLMSTAENQPKGESLTAAAIDYLRKQIPDGSGENEKNAAKQLALWIADLHASAQHNDEVPKIHEEVLEKFGADDGVLNRLAEWYKSKGRWEEARKTYRRFANKIEGLNQVAYSYRQENKKNEAIGVYQELLAADSEHQTRWLPELAQVYREVGKRKEAIEIYEQLAAADSGRSGHWRWNVAYTYHENGQHKEAIGNYRLCENFPDNYKQMASCHRSLKEFDEALSLYNQIAAGHPGSAPWALLEIGRTYESMGQTEKAIKAYQTVCKRFPQDGHASQAHAHLQTKYKITVTLGGATSE